MTVLVPEVISSTMNGDDIKVCQNFFLSTLGYTSDSVLKCLFAQMTPTKITPPPPKRGKHHPKHKLPQETVEDIKKHKFVQSFC